MYAYPSLLACFSKAFKQEVEALIIFNFIFLREMQLFCVIFLPFMAKLVIFVPLMY
jgi:hypothetical protein